MRFSAAGGPRRVRRAVLSEVHAYWRRTPIERGTVLFESFAGNGALCNPEAIFRELSRAEDLAHLRFVWAVAGSQARAQAVAEFGGDPRVSVVRRGAAAYFKALATSEYLVNNATFPAQFAKRPGQIYLNTWHGTPLKRMGFDIPGGAGESANTIRNFLAADYLLSSGPYMTDTMYAKAYKLDGVYPGQIIEAGSPRVDRQFLTAGEGARIRERLGVGARRIALFAPTWRGDSFRSPEGDLADVLQATEQFSRALDPADWAVLLKVHQVIYAIADKRSDARAYLVPNSIPTNSVLAVTDVLITDYSSIVVDFLVTRRPVVFYVPDQDSYAGRRGLYRALESLPGEVTRDRGSAVDALRRAVAGSGDDSRNASLDAAIQEFAPHEDGRAAARVVDVVFRGRDGGAAIRRFEPTARQKLLIHLGAMRENGITTSALSLVNALDHERFDVSVTYPDGPAARRLLDGRSIHPAVRHLPRVGGMNGSKLVSARRSIADRLRHRVELEQAGEREVWAAEWLRCFGSLTFDAVVDFSGYGPMWARLLLASPPAQRSIWLHNDMAADSRRAVHGRRIHERSLTAVFSHYRDYDRLVSVSPALAEINRAGLAGWASAEQFVHARNCIDADTIRRAGAEPGVLDVPPDGTVFVTVGRLSPEKNHARLIRAFAAVHTANPGTRLWIVGGGPLRAELERLVTALGLEGCVSLLGPLANPYPAIAAADCFVLSSDYEGQPMVLLEAAVLEKPIITVEFASVRDAVADGALIVPQSDAALTSGMIGFLNGEVAPVRFDAVAHNRRAVAEFEAVLRARPALHRSSVAVPPSESAN